MREELQMALQVCSLHALLMITSGVLSRTGFGDIQILDRRLPRQKSRFGGYELASYSTLGTMPMRIAIKVLRDPICLRHLDEIAGVVDRERTDMGMVVSPHPLSGGALKHHDSYKKSRIEVLDGPVLAELMMRTGTGISDGEVDFTYFDSLEEASPKILRCLKELGHE